MSKAKQERQDALAVQERVFKAYGRCIESVLGLDAVGSLWFSLGTLLQSAERNGWVYAEKDMDIAAASLLCSAGLFTRRTRLSVYFDITPQGRETAKRVFHPQHVGDR